MGTQELHHLTGKQPVTVHLVIVSSSRSAASDEAGPLMERLLAAAGHQVMSRQVIPGETATIEALLLDLVAQPAVQAIIFAGGTGIAARETTVDAVRPHLQKELPGFGELFRQLSFQNIGPAAFRSRACCGVASNTLVFILPGSHAACQLALEALILPELRHLISEINAEMPAVTAAPPAPSPTVIPPPAVVPTLAEKRVAPAPEPAPAALDGAWRQALALLGANLDPGRWQPIPEALRSMAPVRNVLESAGQRGTAVMPDGSLAGLFGYPDLLRPGSKVLLVQDGLPLARLVALHRLPRWVGLASDGDDPLPASDTPLPALCREITGQPTDMVGSFFARDGRQIYALAGDRVSSWDGSRLRDEGPTLSALASLVLRWSQR